MSHFYKTTFVVLFFSALATVGVCQKIVTVENFIQAETHSHFKTKVEKGHFGKLGHNRTVIPIDNQYIRRMNRDTRYSSGIFDLSEPLTVILPDVGDRFQSLTVTTDEHFIKKTIYKPGKYLITKNDVGSRYVQVTVRTFVDADSESDNALVSKIQDRILVQQRSPGSFEIPSWDESSLNEVRKSLLTFVKGIPNTKYMFGDRGEVDPIRHLIGTAAGYGGLSEDHAMYLNVYPEENDGKKGYVLNVPSTVPVEAFWSISVYNKDGYFEKNDIGRYSYNNVTAEKNEDGSITIHLGGDSKMRNHIPISPGWSYNIRMYRPKEEILSGLWKFPDAQPLGN